MENIEKPVPLWEKYALTIKEASEYFNIGEKKMRSITGDSMEEDFVFTNGNRIMVKRKKFEEYMDKISSI